MSNDKLKPVQGISRAHFANQTYTIREVDDAIVADGSWPPNPREFLCVPRGDIPALALEYLEMLKTAKTMDWCACEWAIHPDDVDLVAGDECKYCHKTEAEHPTTYEANYRHPGSLEQMEKVMECKTFSQRQRRLHRLNESPECPIHTEAGRIMGFFRYLFPLKEEDCNCEGLNHVDDCPNWVLPK